MSWQDFLPILYRVANKAARLDFSAIQLTDSEQSWRARGFYPQDVKFVEGGSVGRMSFSYSDEYMAATSGEHADPEVDPEGGYPIAAWGLLEDLYDNFSTPIVSAAPDVDPTMIAGSMEYETSKTGDMMFYGNFLYASPETYKKDTDTLWVYIESKLNEILKIKDASIFKDKVTSDNFDSQNPIHILYRDVFRNIYVQAAIQGKVPGWSVDGHALKSELLDWGIDHQGDLTIDSVDYVDELTTQFTGTLNNVIYAGGQNMCEITYIKWREGWSGMYGSYMPYHIEELGLRCRFVNDPNTYFDITYRPDPVATDDADGTEEYLFSKYNNIRGTLVVPLTAAEVSGGGVENVLQGFTAQLGTTIGASVEPCQQYISETGEQAFISWDEIQKATYSDGMALPIVKVSDNILYNTQTGTYAYFSNPEDISKAVAIVGTMVVTGDPTLGVAFKSGSGESYTYYYHADAIRALLSAEQEYALLGGSRYLASQTKKLAEFETTMPMIFETGIKDGALLGLSALFTKDAVAEEATLSLYPWLVEGAKGTRYSLINAGVTSMTWGVGDYVSVSQSNRVVNMVARMFTVKTVAGSSESEVSFCAVVRFKSAGIETGPAVTANSTLQDLLNAPAQPPIGDDKVKWEQNKADCNAYVNWIYGTTGYTYIETGYLEPEVTIYLLGDKQQVFLPDNVFIRLTADQKAAIKLKSCSWVAGGIAEFGGNVGCSSSTGTVSDVNAQSYWLAEDASAIVSGGRLYMHVGMYENLTPSTLDSEQIVYVNSGVLTSASLTLGSTFYPETSTDVRMTVVKTEAGIVTCQVGPIAGIPVKDLEGNTGFISKNVADHKNSHTTVNDVKATSECCNLLYRSYSDLFGGDSRFEYLGIAGSPVKLMEDTLATGYAVYDGELIEAIEYTAESVVTQTRGPVELSAYQGKALSELPSTVTVSFGYGQKQYLTEAYYLVSFDSTKFTIKDGKLTAHNATAANYLSASLFTNLNDLIIDEVITQSVGAIPINQVPAGSVVKIGSAFYCAVGASEVDKAFVGYTPLAVLTDHPTMQEVAISFGNHFIRAGSQYVNITSFFKSLTLLNSEVRGGSQRVEEYITSLDRVYTSTLSTSPHAKYVLYSDPSMSPTMLQNSRASSSSVGYAYTPVLIRFNGASSAEDVAMGIAEAGLMAYKISAPNEAVPRYVICTTAKSSYTGCFADLPFFTDNSMSDSVKTLTLEVGTASFKFNANTKGIWDDFLSKFKETQLRDGVGLVRTALSVAILWLMIASWVCFTMRYARLTTILEEIRTPVRNSTTKGFDLFKFISLGTITLDTDFNLGRFLQYNAILALLLCVVRLSGRITF